MKDKLIQKTAELCAALDTLSKQWKSELEDLKAGKSPYLSDEENIKDLLSQVEQVMKSIAPGNTYPEYQNESLIKNFSDFINEEVDPNVMKAAEEMKLEISPENAGKMAEFQKKNGGVVRIPDEENAKKLFTDLGYEIKTIKSSELYTGQSTLAKQIMDDIENFNPINYVLILINDEIEMIEPMIEPN